MACLRDRNIRIVIILLFAVLLGACRRETADAEKTIPADRLEQVRPLALRMDYLQHDRDHCSLAVKGDSLYFYHLVRKCSGKKYFYLMKKKRLEDWQIRNLQQLRDAVALDSVCFDSDPDWIICGVSSVELRIDGKRRLYIYGHDLEASMPPALLTLYLYIKSISPYDYLKDEWLDYVEYID